MQMIPTSGRRGTRACVFCDVLSSAHVLFWMDRFLLSSCWVGCDRSVAGAGRRVPGGQGVTILSRWSKGPREPPERLSQAKTDRKSRAQDVSQGRRLLVSRGVHCYPLGILARASLEIPLGTQLSTCVSTRGLCAGRLGGYILRSSCTAGVYLEEVALVSLETACCRNKAYCLASLAATLCPPLMGRGQ